MDDEVENCSECDGRKFEETPDGYSSCVACGLVQSGLSIDYGQDWRSYEDGSGKDSERAGPAKDILQHDYGITTEISPMTGGYLQRQGGSGVAYAILTIVGAYAIQQNGISLRH